MVYSLKIQENIITINLISMYFVPHTTVFPLLLMDIETQVDVKP